MTTIDTLRSEGERFMEAVSREYWLAYAGHKPEAELRPVYERHASLFGPDPLAMLREQLLGAEKGSDVRRTARLLMEWLAESASGRVLAEVEEREIAWEGSAVASLGDGRRVPYQRLAIEIANAGDRAERLLLDDARAALVQSGLAPMRRERFQRERDFVEGLELANGYVATFETLSGVDARALAEQCRRFLRDSEGMWNDVLPSFARKRLGVGVEELTRADALFLFRAREFDDAFPASEMERVVKGQVAEMGSDPTVGGRVEFDTVERAGKRPRAFCAPVRVPDEVHLVLRPHGGRSDWTTLLHELGHAMHFASMRKDLPFEARWVGDNSITEGFAMLFDHRMQDRHWVLRYTGVGKVRLAEYLRSAALEELHFLRRYCAKLLYELELSGGEAPWDALPDRYVETLSNATGFRYRAPDAFVDVDPRFYSTRYLRAWQLQAVMNEALVERFDEDWWRNPRCGAWLTGELMGPGQWETADELATRVAGAELSFAPNLRHVERLLG